MNKIALYPGTFDPMTFGHLDVLERACKIFDHIVVAIAAGVHKTPLFNLTERVALAEQLVSHLPNVKVAGFNCLLLDFAEQQNATIILRGLRTVTDFDYEFQLASTNRTNNPKIESIFLMPAEKYMCISSSLIREVATLGGDVSKFVPPIIAKALQEKIKR